MTRDLKIHMAIVGGVGDLLWFLSIALLSQKSDQSLFFEETNLSLFGNLLLRAWNWFHIPARLILDPLLLQYADSYDNWWQTFLFGTYLTGCFAQSILLAWIVGSAIQLVIRKRSQV